MFMLAALYNHQFLNILHFPFYLYFCLSYIVSGGVFKPIFRSFSGVWFCFGFAFYLLFMFYTRYSCLQDIFSHSFYFCYFLFVLCILSSLVFWFQLFFFHFGKVSCCVINLCWSNATFRFGLFTFQILYECITEAYFLN